MICRDEPKFGLQIVAPFFYPDETQDVLVIHVSKFEDLLFGLPGLFVLDRKHFDRDQLIFQLRLPNCTESTASFYF